MQTIIAGLQSNTEISVFILLVSIAAFCILFLPFEAWASKIIIAMRLTLTIVCAVAAGVTKTPQVSPFTIVYIVALTLCIIALAVHIWRWYQQKQPMLA